MSCSVINCYSKRYGSTEKQTFFLVKESWISVNPVGWKTHKLKRICSNHFHDEDILGTRQRFIKRGAIPQIFLKCDSEIPK